jgi:hypothetical protein
MLIDDGEVGAAITPKFRIERGGDVPRRMMIEFLPVKPFCVIKRIGIPAVVEDKGGLPALPGDYDATAEKDQDEKGEFLSHLQHIVVGLKQLPQCRL